MYSGHAKWLEPYTWPTRIAVAKSGVKQVDVMCTESIGNCLETLDEVWMHAPDTILAVGCKSF